MNKKHVIIGAVIVVIGALIFLMRGGDDVVGDAVEATSETKTETVAGEEVLVTLNEITAPRQSAGKVARVDRLLLQGPGYVVAHKVNDDGTTGAVIGHSELIDQRETLDITFTLTGEIAEGQNIVLMIHKDDGNGTYEFPGPDAPILNEEGNPVAVQIPVGPAGEEISTDENNESEDTINDEEVADEDLEEGSAEEEPAEEDTDEEEQAEVDTAVSVAYANDGFEPKEVTVNVGDTVRWTNNSTRNMWVASAAHPTHTLYPEKSEEDCLGSSFDACAGVAPGESWEFTFYEEGSWNYHDHLNAGRFGTIVVE